MKRHSSLQLRSRRRRTALQPRSRGTPAKAYLYNLLVPKTCADAGLTNPVNAKRYSRGGQYVGLDVGSPLRTPLGTPDPTYVSNGTPGVGSGLDGVPDVMYVQSVSPFSTVPQQFNGVWISRRRAEI